MPKVVDQDIDVAPELEFGDQNDPDFVFGGENEEFIREDDDFDEIETELSRIEQN